MNTPRTDVAVTESVNCGDLTPFDAIRDVRLVIVSRTLERELSACRRDLAAEERGTANLNRCLDASRAECQRLRDALSDALGTLLAIVPHDEGNSMEVVMQARAALQEVTPHNCALEGCADD